MRHGQVFSQKSSRALTRDLGISRCSAFSFVAAREPPDEVQLQLQALIFGGTNSKNGPTKGDKYIRCRLHDVLSISSSKFQRRYTQISISFSLAHSHSSILLCPSSIPSQ